MSRKGVLIVVAVGLLLAVPVGGGLAWYVFKDRVAVATYRVEKPEGMGMTEILSNERELMESDAVLKPVVSTLDLVNRWKLKTEEEALARVRKKLIVRDDPISDRVRVIYRDRNQDRALEILDEINRVFAQVRASEASRKALPRILPPDQPAP